MSLFSDTNAGPQPPVAEIVATTVPTTSNNNNNNNDEQRKTHIEVCIRIRPLLQQGSIRESSNGFLLSSSNNNNNSTNSTTPGTCTSGNSLLRRSNISRLGLFRQTSNSTTPPPPSSSRKEQNQQHSPPEHEQEYAWKVLENHNDTKNASQNTTIRQTCDLIAGRTHQYTLDRIYGPQCSTHDVYTHSVLDLVHAAMDGYHTSVMAYGQTSTGKTHTITGTVQQPGILPLAIQECFNYLQNSNNNNREYLLRVSYLEVYKENIRDLLAVTTPGSSSSTPTPIRLFEASPEQGGGLIIRGLREQVVTNANQVFNLLKKGETHRQVGATHLNQHSSRSHTIVRIWIESRCATASAASAGAGCNGNNNNDAPVSTAGQTAPTVPASSSTSSLSSSVTGQTTAVGAVRISSLSIVDLAGSESVRLSKDASRQKEGHYINQSLMALGKVVYALSEAATTQNPTLSKLFAGANKQQQHIPYRDSKLTRLLQPSLSGNAQVVLICCISPLQDHVEESHNTFKFAIRAKKIPQRATIDEVDGDDNDKATLLQSYRQEIEDLKQQLKEAREQQNRLLQFQQLEQQQLSSLTTTPVVAIMEQETEDEVHELVHAIQAMERLILKSKPNNGIGSSTTTMTTPARTLSSSTNDTGASSQQTPRPEDLLDDDDNDDDDDFDQHEGELMALANVGASASTKQQRPATIGNTTPMRRSSGIPMSSCSRSTTIMTTTPMQNNNNSGSSSTVDDAQLHRELGRIQSLLGSVLKKRKQQQQQNASQQQQNVVQNSNINGNNNNGGEQAAAEVRHLRAKLEQQEISTSLRKADSSFLQQQLQEKDDLLQEVSNILEQLEARQVQLEQENAYLKQQLAEFSITSSQSTAAAAATNHHQDQSGASSSQAALYDI